MNRLFYFLFCHLSVFMINRIDRIISYGKREIFLYFYTMYIKKKNYYFYFFWAFVSTQFSVDVEKSLFLIKIGLYLKTVITSTFV